MSLELEAAGQTSPVRSRPYGRAEAAGAVVALAAGVLAFASRLWHLGERSIWLDEAWGWRATRLPVRQMVDWAAESKDPPLYYFVLRLVTACFGDSEAALRAPSAVASALTVLLLAYAGWRSGGWLLAGLASALLFVNASSITFAQEARMYPLVGLLALGSALALARLLQRPDWTSAALYAPIAAALAYTHYSGLVVLGLQASLVLAYGAARVRASGDRRTLVVGGAALAAVALSYALWLPNLWTQSTAGAFYIPPPDRHLAEDVLRASTGLGDRLLVLAFAAVLAPFAVRAVYARRADPRVVCVSALAIVPGILLAYSIAVTPVFDVRQSSPYLPAAAFAWSIAMIELIETVRRRGEWLRTAAVVAGCAAAALCAVSIVRELRSTYDAGPVEDWRAAAARAQSSGGTIFVWRRYASTPLRYYLPENADVREIPPDVFDGAALQSGAPQPAALLLSHETDGERALLLGVLGRSYTVGTPTYFAGIAVYQLRPRPPSLQAAPAVRSAARRMSSAASRSNGGA